MKVETTRLWMILVVCLVCRATAADKHTKRQQCRDFAGDRSNCQRFVRCFHNLRVLFTCAEGTSYVPELKACVAKELVTDCGDSNSRDEVTVSLTNNTQTDNEYLTIEADLNTLDMPMQKSLSSSESISTQPKQFGCSSYCYNQGVCILAGQSISCRCQTGYVGSRCQVARSPTRQAVSCATISPCLNGGTCVDNLGVFGGCNCPPMVFGDLCEVDDRPTTISPITAGLPCTFPTNPCRNGANCLTVEGGGFRCVCLPGFTGSLCESQDSTQLTGQLTGCGTGNPCLNQGVCVQTQIGSQCQCPGSFTGSTCQTSSAIIIVQPPNRCQPSPCQNGGVCYLSNGGFACTCPPGFSGTCCEINLALLNPCYNNPCLSGGTCRIASTNAYQCVCPTGFTGVRCEQQVCNPNPCLYGGSCFPVGNTFQCFCPPQYTGRCCELLIVTTTPPDPCAPQPCQNGGRCTPTGATTFICSCTPSYYGQCCELRNYCQPDPCNGRGQCVATTTGYICQCSFPYTGSNCEIQITTPAPQPLCACIVCPCPQPVVNVVNPCLPNPCQNSGGCAVQQGIARCYCQAQFTGYYCQFTRKRTINTAACANVTCLNGGECYVSDKGARCTCPKDFFGQRCELMNRPRTCNPSPCGKNGECISTKDGYKCVCKSGTTGVLCEQIAMPRNYRWCPIDCRSGTSCVYEGTTPKCRVLNAY